MSLINQMLKDLEHRRSQDTQGGAGIVPGIKRYSVATRRRSPLLLVLSSVSIVLLLVIAFLLWDKMSQPDVITQLDSQPVNQATVSETQPVEKQPVIQKTAATKSSPVVVKKAVTKTPVKPKPVVKKIVKTISAEDEVPDTAPAGTVKKTTRTLKPSQQAEVYYKKGHVLLTRGQNSSGEQSLRKALEVYPEHIKAREVLAGLYIKTGRVVEAGELLDEGLIHKPGHSLFAMLQARLLLQQNRAQAATSVLENHAPEVISNLDYHSLMAVAYQKQAQHDKTVAKYQQVLNIKPAAGIWWVGMAISLEALGRQAKAVEAYTKARKTGTLTVDLLRYTDNRLAVLRDSGYSHSE